MTTDEPATSVREPGSQDPPIGAVSPQGRNAVPQATGLASRRIAWPEITVLVGLIAIGAAVRASGFTSLDVWFDDAWAAAPAKVGLSQAVHMVLTAPGYSLALRSWLRLDPSTTWFGQLPAFAFGLLAVPVVYVMLRYFRSSRWVALAGAAVIAMGPLTVQYSTRLKEYPFDLLGACLLLVLAERVRRKPTQRRVVALATVSVALVFFSAACVTVVAAVWATLLFALYRDPRSRRYLAVWGAFTVTGCIAVWALFLRHIPPVLTFNWRRRGYLMDYRSFSSAERSASLISGGFFHAVFGYPVPVNYFQSSRGLHAPSVAVFGVILLGLAIGVPFAGSIRRRRVAPALPAAVTLLLAVILALADRVPLGDGRTDEVLYPALLVCLAAVVAAAVPLARGALRSATAAQVVGATLAAIVLCGAVAFGVAHPAKYPTISLRGVEAGLDHLERPGDVVFVDTFNSFGWCYYGLSPCRTRVGGAPPWPQGFRPASTDPTVFIARHYGIPMPELAAAQRHATRIWYVGFTYGTFDVGADPARYRLGVPTYMSGLLRTFGWRPAPSSTATAIFSVHAYAILYVHGPRR